MNFSEMDDKVSVFAQIEADGGPVILMNKFTVAPSDWTSYSKLGRRMRRL